MKELVNIKIENIEFRKNFIKILAASTKNKQQRAAAISRKLSLQLNEFAKENKLSEKDNLFSTRQAKTISDKRVFQIIKKYSSQAGFENVGPQTLRYSHIAHSFAVGKSIQEIESQTGIKNLNKFHLYGTLFMKKQKHG